MGGNGDLVGPPILIVLGLVVMGIFAIAAVRTGYVSTRRSERREWERRGTMNDPTPDAKNLPAEGASAAASEDSEPVSTSALESEEDLAAKARAEWEALPRIPAPTTPSWATRVERLIQDELGLTPHRFRRDNGWVVWIECGSAVLEYQRDGVGWSSNWGLWDEDADRSIRLTYSELIGVIAREWVEMASSEFEFRTPDPSVSRTAERLVAILLAHYRALKVGSPQSEALRSVIAQSRRLLPK